MKKHCLTLLFCFILIFILTGCQNKEMIVLTPNGDAVIKEDGSSSQNNNTTEEKKENKQESNNTTNKSRNNSNLIHVGFAQVGSESGWRMAQTQSMKETFTEEAGYQFDFVDCNNDQHIQIDTIKKFISDQADYIILDPIVEDGYDDVLKEAKNAGIPVIVVDRNINADSSLYSCWVGSDFTKEGQDAANWLADYLTKNGRGGEQLNIVTILGSDGASAMIGRTEGFEQVAAGYANWNLLDKQSGDFTEEGGNAVMKAFLRQHPDIDVVVCQNDDEAFGAIEAIHDAGKTCGPDGDIILISFDATKKGFERMIDGEIHVDIECNPLEGPFVADLIQKLEKGETVESIQYMEEGVFPAEEAAEVINSRVY